MSEGRPKYPSEFKEPSLADHALTDIASRIAGALLDLTGNVYEVKITAVDRKPKGEYMPEWHDIMDIRMRVQKPSRLTDWPATKESVD